MSVISQFDTPIVQPLPRGRRRFVFLSLLTLFVCAVPVFVFYATGYRYNFFSEFGSITATGGMYLSVGIDGGEVYLNEAPVRDLRVFRKALYIQNLTPGLQRIHVQAPDLHTWVKELPVYPHIVTEAEAFLLPVRPQIRPIAEYQTSTSTQVFLGVPKTTTLFDFASSSVPFTATTSRATTTLIVNSEFDFVEALFASSTQDATTLLNRVVEEVSGVFTFSPSASTTEGTTTASTTKQQNNVILYERGGDLYVRYIGNERSTPYYFCIPLAAYSATEELYGAAALQSIKAYADEASVLNDISETSNTKRLCRDEIKIDRQGQKVLSFDFLPGTSDVVLLHRADGVFAVEVDDRSWQNTQRLYGDSATQMIVNNGRIYVKDGEYFLELLTTLITI